MSANYMADIKINFVQINSISAHNSPVKEEVPCVVHNTDEEAKAQRS